ncbi:MAG: hypothetical protein WCB48_17645, partial [Casimicrobiaceae bacterium]
MQQQETSRGQRKRISMAQYAAFAIVFNRFPSRRRGAANLQHRLSTMPDTTATLQNTVNSAPSVRDADLANSIRALAMDAVEAAKSGHPGMPMGMAEIAV